MKASRSDGIVKKKELIPEYYRLFFVMYHGTASLTRAGPPSKRRYTATHFAHTNQCLKERGLIW